MEGTLPLPRPLRVDEVEKFSAMHVVMVMDMAQGFKNPEIAAKHKVTDGMVCNLRNHPWTQQILSAMLSRLADRLTDPMERLKSYANEAVDVKIGILRDREKPAGLRNAIASDILDRAGYGVKQKIGVEVEDRTKPSVPASHIGRLTEALMQAQSVRSVSFERFVVKTEPKTEDGIAGKDVSEEISAISADSGASHAGPSSAVLPVEEQTTKKLSPEEKEHEEELAAEKNLPKGVILQRQRVA